ncbi:methyl-CpG-binding domain protein 3-like 2B isoform X1 [Mustela putorius furo]|uniref:Methyl-CpG-binding domain protein 3-like 2B isoform X1 n=2 Tax=Mustela putorius furo TaxID=9669 RepID=A0A8U0SEL7_MUSPF|nr:methyl-CpG-binding domain protein 3-like 2B isoform X1 [Mustela putorius furo]XP_044941284.1 methyl-CpG-binding domain protein 3-like 2B isoform X1 [Mustela putorius furo]
MCISCIANAKRGYQDIFLNGNQKQKSHTFQQATSSHIRSAAMEGPASTRSSNQPAWSKLKRNMMLQTIEKKRQVHLTKAKKRHHERIAPPTRLTSCIFKRPVTSITSHPGNEVRYNQWDRTLEKPQQISAYSRLQGLQAHSSEGELLSTLDFISTSQVIALGSADGGSLPSGPGPSMVPFWAGMVPGVGLHLPPPICRQQVTPGDIRRQTWKVKKSRERLAKALRADRLAREVERARSEEKRSDN